MSEKTDLQEKARTLGLDDSGTIAELQERIAAALAAPAVTANPEPVVPDGRPEPDAAAPNPELAQRVYDAAMDEIEAARVKKVEDAAKATKAAAKARAKDAVKQMKTDRPDALPGHAESQERERAGKEGSLAAGDPRDSVFDVAPGKSLDDVLERNAALAAGEFTDTPDEPQPVQFYVVVDELDLIEVARKVGLPDHSELAAINGRHSGILGVQRGQRVVLPARYRFDGIENVVTEGDWLEQLAGSEATA